MTARDLLVCDSNAYACSNSDLGEVLFNGVIISSLSVHYMF